MPDTDRTYSPQQALLSLQKLCSRSEKCAFDLKLKLQKWGLQPAECEQILAKLQKDGFVDEERYIRAYAQEKLLIAHWGRHKITRMLSVKQLPTNLIEAILQSFDSDRYRECLLELLMKKSLSLKNEAEGIRKAKLLRFALSRGYEYNLAYELLSSAFPSEE